MTRFALRPLPLLIIAGCGFPEPGDPEPRYPEFPLTPTPGILWIDVLDTELNDWPGGIAVDTSGAYAFLGLTSPSHGPDWRIELRKYSPTGRVLWVRAIERHIHTEAVAAGAGGVYVTGASRDDIFARAYDTDGNVLWTREIGTAEEDWAWLGITVFDGSIYIAGVTEGDLGEPNAGGEDAVLLKLDTDGNLIWTRQLGTTELDRGSQVAGVDGRVYVAGLTRGALEGTDVRVNNLFVRQLDPDGNAIWTRQFGTWRSGEPSGIGVDGSGVYVAEYDVAAVHKHGPTGDRIWVRRIAERAAISAATTADRGVYVGGFTAAALEGPILGSTDAFVRRYDVDGTVTCTMQWGSAEEDGVASLAALGGVYPGIYASGRWNENLFVARLRPCYLPAHIDFMEEVVRDLIVAGALEQGLGQAMVAGLDAAAAEIEEGDPAGAADLLREFHDQTEELIRNRTLTSDQATPLLFNALALLRGLDEG